MKIKAYKIQPHQLDEILQALRGAVYTIGQDRPLDWEDRTFAETRIFDAINELTEIRRQTDAIFASPTVAENDEVVF